MPDVKLSTGRAGAPDRGAAKAWLIGGGVGSLAAAAFMIRDGGMRATTSRSSKRCP